MNTSIQSHIEKLEGITNNYVAGFLFRNRGRQGTEVALVQKNRPAWQVGKWNGIGGRIEEAETPLQAMRREFLEETGVSIGEWRQFAVLRHLNSLVYFFASFEQSIETPSTTTDETIRFHNLSNLGLIHTVANLQWLIPLAVSSHREIAFIEDDTPLPIAPMRIPELV